MRSSLFKSLAFRILLVAIALLAPIWELQAQQVVYPYQSTSGTPVKATYSGVGSNVNIELLAAQGANVKLYITEITCVQNSATAISASLKDGTNTIWVIPCPVSSGGGGHVTFPHPIQLTANTALNFNITTTLAANQALYLSAQAFTAR